MITMKSLYKLYRPMKLRDVVCGNESLYMIYDFDPWETSFETWMGFYDEYKFFIPALTKKRLREILKEHRDLYARRKQYRWEASQKHPMTDYFDGFDSRLFPLKPARYGKWMDKVKKRFRVKKLHIHNDKGRAIIDKN